MYSSFMFEKVGFHGRLRSVYGRLRKLPAVGPGLRWLANRLYPRGSRVWVTVRGGLAKGLWMHLDPRYEEGYYTAEYEIAVQRTLAEHLHRGDTFYDVGAHIGFLSLGAARLVGAEGEVVAFEADREIAARIEEHSYRNSLAQVHVVPQAVWSGAGRLRLERATLLSSRNTGAVLENPTPGRNSDAIEVEAIALDDYVRGRRPPSLIKIDVEGAELHVLKGAEGLVSERRPIVLCEVHSAELAVHVEKWLLERGYALEWFTGETQFPRHLIAQHREAWDSYSER